MAYEINELKTSQKQHPSVVYNRANTSTLEMKYSF